MAQLKAGSVFDFADSMTAMIEQAMNEEWARVYPDDSLPGELGRQDRLVLFAAVAKGVLRYLHKHQRFIATTEVQDEVGGHEHRLDFDLIENLGPPLEPGP